MLNSLTIKNYALIEDIRMDFDRGMTIITGETGAGKSILLGALALLLGRRADLSSVKDASKKCIVEAVFQVEEYNLLSVFEENGLDYESETIIRREILPTGKSRAFVNDTPVNLSQLQALAPYLVDIHSQDETMELISEDFQIEVIDALAKNEEIQTQYRKILQHLRKKEAELKKLMTEKEEALKELDYNTFLYNELKEARLEEINQAELEEIYETLNNSEAIQEAFSEILELFEAEQIGSLETAKQARIVLGRIKNFSTAYEEYWDRLNSVLIELEDLLEEIRNSSETVAADPQQLLEVNEKLQTLYRLQHKHSLETVEELIGLQNSLEEKVNKTIGLDSEIEKLQKEIQQLTSQVSELGKTLHTNRKKSIPELKRQLEAILAQLGLPHAQFVFDLKPAAGFLKNGTDTLELLFSANKGIAPGSLRKIASGGEKSRIMLAVKSVLATYKNLPTIIFDEIDTGVSGEIASKMAAIMVAIGKELQVLAITHLPQIAAKGETHFKIFKEESREVTATHFKKLNHDERILEIAQMLGGKNISEAAIANAKELLN